MNPSSGLARVGRRSFRRGELRSVNDLPADLRYTFPFGLLRGLREEFPHVISIPYVEEVKKAAVLTREEARDLLWYAPYRQNHRTSGSKS